MRTSSGTVTPSPTEDVLGILRLYVAGPGPRAEEAWHNVRAACQSLPRARFDVQLVDVSERPDAARQADIVFLPTLVRVRPGPERRWIGDFASAAAIARALVADDV